VASALAVRPAGRPSPAQHTSGPLAPTEQVYAVLREIAAWGWGEVRALLGH